MVFIEKKIYECIYIPSPVYVQNIHRLQNKVFCIMLFSELKTHNSYIVRFINENEKKKCISILNERRKESSLTIVFESVKIVKIGYYLLLIFLIYTKKNSEYKL